MSRRIYGEKVKGYSHFRNDMDCQDNFKYLPLSEDISLIAVADGHGSDSCPYSKTGSEIAANVFCSVMKSIVENFSENMDFLMTYLNREGELKVAQSIDAEWKRRVWKVHTNHKREKPVDESGTQDKAAVYKQYGTTLLGMMITPTFIFAFQLGDGDIVYVNGFGVQPVIDGDKILGTETHSLCKMDSWKKVITMIRKRDELSDTPYLYIMSTDGFANSFRSQDDFNTTCKDYYTLIKEHGFDAVTSNLKDWLNETSELGCGDDITVVLTYVSDSEVKEQ